MEDICFCFLWIVRCELMFMLLLSGHSEGLQVIGGRVTVVQGATVTLPCQLTDSKETLKQILWQRSTRGRPFRDNFFIILEKNGKYPIELTDDRFRFVGNFTEKNGSLQLSNASLMDEGSYSCIFLLLESGNHKTEVSLNLLVPPVTSLKNESVVLGSEEVLLATCTAAAARPPGEVRWVTGNAKVRVTTNSTRHDNDTTTTKSSLFGVPTRDLDGQLIQCVVSSVALDTDKFQPFFLQLFFSPSNVSIIESSDDSLLCISEARPEPTFNWTRSGLALSLSGVRAEGAQLKFLSRSLDLKGLYHCEVSNLYGRQSAQVFVHVLSVSSVSPPSLVIGWSLFGLLLLLLIVEAFTCYRFGFLKRRTSKGFQLLRAHPKKNQDQQLQKGWTKVKVIFEKKVNGSTESGVEQSE
ncbi:nectin-4-like isoform X2 [Gouania willdenowi]|uniref:nectin-4-like isoform X2 n=1 Tax=Gouania willdenowi TaxID=441366 RepID=UPI001056D260|nr:nectin-4-like isoform X2 [Gouania willdenowi]